jgi:hypothetical protein
MYKVSTVICLPGISQRCRRYFFGLLQKRKSHGSDAQLYALRFWHPSSHFTPNRHEQYPPEKKNCCTYVFRVKFEYYVPVLELSFEYHDSLYHDSLYSNSTHDKLHKPAVYSTQLIVIRGGPVK